MNMNEKFPEMLRDPLTKETLTRRDSSLIHEASGRRYRIADDIPRFLETEEIGESNRKSADFYNIWAPFYEIAQKIWYAFWGGERKARNAYLKYLDVKAGDRVLEVSVGTGANIRFLPAGTICTGLDISIGQLMQCRKNIRRRHLNLNLVHGNAEQLPFPDEAFDVVYHVGGINLFNDKKAAIREMVRVAKKGSTLLIADETEKVAKFYEHIPFFCDPFKNRNEAIRPPVDLLPAGTTVLACDEIRNGSLYCLVFRKD